MTALQLFIHSENTIDQWAYGKPRCRFTHSLQEGVANEPPLSKAVFMVLFQAAAILPVVADDMPPELQDRYVWRHPGPTLAFFGIRSGMNVVEALPDRGW